MVQADLATELGAFLPWAELREFGQQISQALSTRSHSSLCCDPLAVARPSRSWAIRCNTKRTWACSPWVSSVFVSEASFRLTATSSPPFQPFQPTDAIWRTDRPAVVHGGCGRFQSG